MCRRMKRNVCEIKNDPPYVERKRGYLMKHIELVGNRTFYIFAGRARNKLLSDPQREALQLATFPKHNMF